MAKEICNTLEDNHISTMAFGPAVTQEYKEDSTIIPIFVVISTFDTDTARALSDIAEKWKPKGFEGPYIAEMNDIDGMSDSVPDELLDVVMNYQLLEGDDVLSHIPKLSKEHLRAQAELSLRRYIFNLRWTLTQVIKDRDRIGDYLQNLYLYTLSSIRSYHRLTHPWLHSTASHLDQFKQEFPESVSTLDALTGYIGDGREPEGELVDLVTDTMSKVLQPLLYKLDSMG